MASLLLKATVLRNQIVEKEEIEAIPITERDKIYKEIDDAIESGKLVVSDSLLQFSPEENDMKFPFFINISAAIMIIIFGVLLSFHFNQKEQSIVDDTIHLNQTENRIIEAIKTESELKLSEKEVEIQRISNLLDQYKLEQSRLLVTSKNLMEQREKDLRMKMEEAIRSEREKLSAGNLSVEGMNEKVEVFIFNREFELEQQLDKIKIDVENERIQKEIELEEKIRQAEMILEKASGEQLRLVENLERQLEEEKNTALDRYNFLQNQRDEETFVLDQITGFYKSIRADFQSEDKTSALKRIGDMELFLESGELSEYESVQFRKPIDLFLLESLKTLINREPVIIEVIREPSIVEVMADDTELEDLVDQSLKSYTRGQFDEAINLYKRALTLSPPLEKGFIMIKDIEFSEELSQKEKLKTDLQQVDNSFKINDFEGTIEKYGTALESIDIESSVIRKMISQLISSGIALVDNSEILELQKEIEVLEENQFRNLDRISEIELMIASDSELGKSYTNEELVDLLGTKVSIKEVLASESLRTEYPDLLDQLEYYLDSFGRLKQTEGVDKALGDLAAITDYLNGKNENIRALTFNKDQQALLNRILKNIEEL